MGKQELRCQPRGFSGRFVIPCYVPPRGHNKEAMMQSDICLSDVCLSLCLSRTSGLSREQRCLGRLKSARDSDITFKIKRSQVKVTGGGGILWRPPAYRMLCIWCFVVSCVHTRISLLLKNDLLPMQALNDIAAWICCHQDTVPQNECPLRYEKCSLPLAEQCVQAYTADSCMVGCLVCARVINHCVTVICSTPIRPMVVTCRLSLRMSMVCAGYNYIISNNHRGSILLL